MSNVQQLIEKHNFIQNKKNKTALSCNCGDKNGCPLNRNFRTENVIYKCTSLATNYLGVTEWKFKKNWHYNHQYMFRNKDCKNSTTLPTYLRSIKSVSEKQNVNLS